MVVGVQTNHFQQQQQQARFGELQPEEQYFWQQQQASRADSNFFRWTS